ncbi:hypothetical protein [Paraflavitalea sp. CAU 1676]|uniref:hypothetical protein n=1 Tax=Paraflavitalea sp. CAU 1676 TaxID=3032598 RepID=UPI0023DA0648|nr:hypothetical protein [Paraflavitalea sp. CAU 1676]MDF2188507.1 hypothetical protein [Paraflavitalea sp. CAU 1676]
MVILHLDFGSDDQACSADVELEGIADSWDAHATIVGHPTVHQLHVKFWLDQFMLPVFSSKKEAMFFEPLLEAIDQAAKKQLPAEFND